MIDFLLGKFHMDAFEEITNSRMLTYTNQQNYYSSQSSAATANPEVSPAIIIFVLVVMLTLAICTARLVRLRAKVNEFKRVLLGDQSTSGRMAETFLSAALGLFCAGVLGVLLFTYCMYAGRAEGEAAAHMEISMRQGLGSASVVEVRAVEVGAEDVENKEKLVNKSQISHAVTLNAPLIP